MIAAPDVSVVMAVRNSANTLVQTMESILSQAGVSLEFVIINDGSTDDTAVILDGYAKRDDRVRVTHQDNKGLTRALIMGCSIARGQCIARQDGGGDVSLPGRLAHQFAFLCAHPGTAMTACGTRMIGPANEVLYEVCQRGRDLHQGLCSASPEHLLGPSHHGAVMFRRSAYVRAGGYREAFVVAQDLDLWARMAEIGDCLATPQILYEAKLTKGSISHLRRKEQIRVAHAIHACARARRTGADEGIILEGLPEQRVRDRGPIANRIEDARFYYFIGSLLRKRAVRPANSYFLRAVFRWPFDPRAWFGLLRSSPKLLRGAVSAEARPAHKQQ
jgi:glycosyltransferase involved in cell wall biosynthesis